MLAKPDGKQEAVDGLSSWNLKMKHEKKTPQGSLC